MKTKPFNLEEARVGVKVVTRNGRPARIICYDYNNAPPIIALVQDKGLTTEGTRYYRNDGTEISDNKEFDLLLISEEEERTEFYRTLKANTNLNDDMLAKRLQMSAWKEQQMIEKTVEWLYTRLNDVGDMEVSDMEQFIEDFKKYMEE